METRVPGPVLPAAPFPRLATQLSSGSVCCNLLVWRCIAAPWEAHSWTESKRGKASSFCAVAVSCDRPASTDPLSCLTYFFQVIPGV